ncbi:hypothetical protein HDV00_002327 [Rhizophlyctis rosea]|nr:hypothetical protein HDV00_002327 [Rhizophlyctis rosea]
MHFTNTLAAYVAALILPGALGQLTGAVGPTTSRSSKAGKVCNIMSYGAKTGQTGDISAALNSAFAACKNGGTVYVPPGDYGLSTWVTFSNGVGWAFQLDGVIYRNGGGSGTMIGVTGGSDFEFFSSTSKGAIQGLGYSGGTARLMRITKVSHFSIHDIILVDAPVFHLTLDTCTNGEVYNMVIRGRYLGGLDGIDVSGDNIWIHDVEVSNKDECVTIKNTASNMLIESIYCNWSGGCAMGSLSEGIDIKNIHYKNIYTTNSNQMYMIKSSGGSGTVQNCLFENFIGHSNAYSLDLDSAWSKQTTASGSGITFKGLTFRNWSGTCASGTQRGPIKFNCPSAVPCTDITIENFNVWTDSGSSVLWGCQNAYGTGGCLRSGTSGTYTSTKTITSAPTNYQAPKMPWDLTTLGTNTQIPIPTLPASFFPNTPPKTAFLNGSGSSNNGGGATTTRATTTTKASTPATTTKATTTVTQSSSGGTVAKYGQCGGIGYTGPTACASGSACKYSNDYYSQCL